MYKQISEKEFYDYRFSYEKLKDCRCSEIPALEKQVEEHRKALEEIRNCSTMCEKHRDIVYKALAGKE